MSDLPTQPTGAELIAAERQRQKDVEGYSIEHDAKHHTDEFVRAAGAYLGLAQWPWGPEFFKPVRDRFGDRTRYYEERDLVKAGALIAAALDAMKAHEVSRG